MKRIMVFAAVCVVLIYSSVELLPASATGVTSRRDLPWGVDPIDQFFSSRGVSLGFDGWTGQSMVLFYNQDTQTLRQAVRVGRANGNCGVNNSWDCDPILVSYSPLNDLAYYEDKNTGYRQASYVYYEDTTHHVLQYYEHWSDPSGDHASIPLDIINFDDYGGTISSAPSIALDQNHKPHVALIVDMGTEDVLLYVHFVGGFGGSCQQHGGSFQFQCDEILVGANIAAEPSIAMTPGGSPRIAYYSPVNASLRYAYPFGNPVYTNCGPNDDWRCITIYKSYDSGRFPSLAIGDETYIAYYNYTGGELMAAEYVGGSGNCGQDWNGVAFVNRWQCDPIDQVGPGMGVMGLSLVLDGAEPVIAYCDADDGFQYTVKLAQPAWRLGMDVGNCGPIDLFYTWYCQTIDQGPFGLGGEIDMAINPSGALQVAYLEADDDEQQTHLWYASQFFSLFLPAVDK
jgi:hypothetical protein